MGGKAPGVRALAFMGIILIGLAFALDAPDRLAGVATGAPAANIEPIAALVMGWLILNQALKASQIVGALIVMGGIVLLASQPRR